MWRKNGKKLSNFPCWFETNGNPGNQSEDYRCTISFNTKVPTKWLSIMSCVNHMELLPCSHNVHLSFWGGLLGSPQGLYTVPKDWNWPRGLDVCTLMHWSPPQPWFYLVWVTFQVPIECIALSKCVNLCIQPFCHLIPPQYINQSRLQSLQKTVPAHWNHDLCMVFTFPVNQLHQLLHFEHFFIFFSARNAKFIFTSFLNSHLPTKDSHTVLIVLYIWFSPYFDWKSLQN